MLNKQYIEEHLSRLGLNSYEISHVDGDSTEDFIRVELPELEFTTVKDKMFKSNYYKERLVDFDFNQLKYSIVDDIEGYRTLCLLKVSREAYGVSISLIVKRVDFYDSSGKYVPLLGFKMLKQFIKLDKEREQLRGFGL